MAKGVIEQHSAMLYSTTAKQVGNTAHVIKPERPVLHGFNGKFSGVSLFVYNLFYKSLFL